MATVYVPHRESDLDQIAKALSIAATGYGIYANSQQLDRARESDAAAKTAAANNEARAQAQENRAVADDTRQQAADTRRQKGILLPIESAELSKTMSPVEQDTPGAVKLMMQGDDGSLLPTYWRPKTKAAVPKTRAYVSKDGIEREGVIDPTTGHVVQDAADPMLKPKKDVKDLTSKERDTLQASYDKDPQIKRNAMVMDSYADATKLLEEQSPAADHALIVAFMKSIDPGSVVKETEAESAAAFGGLMNRASAKLKELAGDGRLTTDQRNDLFHQIEMQAESAMGKQGVIDNQFKTLASRRGVDERDLRFKQKPEKLAQKLEKAVKDVAQDDSQIAQAEAWLQNEGKTADPATVASVKANVEKLRSIQSATARK